MRFRSFLSVAILAILIAGTDFCVQVGFSVVYSPDDAVAYAHKYAYKVESDGYFWSSTSEPTYYGAGVNVPSATGYDCAHFVSCCIGNEPNEAGGGLNVPTSWGACYGQPGAANLCNWLLNTSGMAEEKSSYSDLSPGDVIGYDWDGGGWIDHVAVYLGDGKVAAHSSSHDNYSWDYGGASFTGTYVHIIPEPGTLTLLCVGAIFMLALQWRRRIRGA